MVWGLGRGRKGRWKAWRSVKREGLAWIENCFGLKLEQKEAADHK